MQYEILDRVNNPTDLRELKKKELVQLSKELRHFLIDSVSKTGGHLAAGLGAIEITIALHKVFNTPYDRLVWDIGHQCYPHKILTGRKQLMPTLRKKDGISGFLKREESEYDVFGAGHSSTSISAAVGIDAANKLIDNSSNTVAVIGDGGLTAGMAYEALSHAGDMKSNILVILNDNEMSISPNVGAVHKYLTRIMTSKTVSTLRKGGKKVLEKIKPIEDLAKRVEGSAKNLIAPGLFFEELGFKYYGPVDGHDVLGLIEILDNLKDKKGPRFLHIMTKKGKGYKLAEQNPISFHGVKPFNTKTGKASVENKVKELTYTNIFSKWIEHLAQRDKRAVAITPAMREGSGLVNFQEKFPDRYFDVGIAEQHAMTFAAGLACNKVKPIVAIYSTFLQRAYDQLIHDVVVQDLDILLAIDRAGIVGADGETHQGIYDISFLRVLPKIILMTPSDESEMTKMLTTGYNHNGLAAVRYPRGNITGIEFDTKCSESITIGKAKKIREGVDIAYLVFGTMLSSIKKVAESNNATIIDMRFVKPIDEDIIVEVCNTHRYIFTVEDNTILGGAGSAVNEILVKYGISKIIKNLGIPDETISHGNQNDILASIGMDYNGILGTTSNHIKFMEEYKKKVR